MITQTDFYQKYQEELFEVLFTGLVGVLFGVLVAGLFEVLFGVLFAGLFTGLVAGLFAGLFGGLFAGLVAVLFGGLVIILVNFSEALPFISGIREILLVVLGIIILIEVFYWLDKEKPKGKATTKFVLRKKFEATCEVLLGLSGIAQIYILTREGIKYLTPEVWNEILKWVGYVGLVSIILVLGFIIIRIWLELNKLKYKK